MSDSDNRQAEPSAYRISMARGLGMVPLAPSLVRSVALAFALLLVTLRAKALADGFVQIIREMFRSLPQLVSGEMTGQRLRAMLAGPLLAVAEPLLVVCLGTWVVLLAMHQLTSGGSWTPTLALPNVGRLLKFWSKFDEDSGPSRPPLGHRLALAVARPLAAFAGCIAVASLLVWSWDHSAMNDGVWSRELLERELAAGRGIMARSLALLVLPLVFLGLMEWFLAKRYWLDRLRQSSDEARREIRELEGDPELKNRRRKLAGTIREQGKIEKLLPATEMVVVGTAMTGLSVQILRLPDGRLAAGEVLRGSIAARFAERCAAIGKPWLRDSQLSNQLTRLVESGEDRAPRPLPDDVTTKIREKLGKKARSA
ncbi:MAG: EscU/YscU/HrcU family type III secretion system export apparatus switch protein [Isosphaeraceae bacterium]